MSADWIVLRMIEGCALRAAFGLSLGGREAYCPVVRERVQGRGADRHKRVVRAFPMLPGYLFARIGRDDQAALVGGPHIRYRVMTGREGWLRVPAYQMALVRDMEARASVSPVSRPLREGDTVRVIRGLIEGDLLTVVAVRKRYPLVQAQGATRPFAMDVNDLEIARA